MLRLICKRLPVNSSASPFIHGFFVSKYFLRPMSEISSTFTYPRNFTVSYLKNSCGLSQNSAISASKKLLIENPEKADSVLELMRTHGLTQSHIEKIIGTRPTLLLADLENKLRPNMKLLLSLGFSGASLAKLLTKSPRVLNKDLVDAVDFFKAQGFIDKQIIAMIRKCPSLLLLNADKTFKPKLDFLKSSGYTDRDVKKILWSDPCILQRSLENHIIPYFQVLRRFVGTDENVLKVMKVGCSVAQINLEKVLEPNISMLKSLGVPDPIILRMFIMHPRTLLLKPQQTTKIFAEVVKLGFHPNTLSFVLAFRSMALISKILWERKIEAYKSFGLSEDQVYSAFKKQPMCMSISEKKIKKMMKFFLTKLDIEPSAICKYPNLFLLSLEKRIIPRCSVLQLLMSAGFMNEDTKLFHHFTMTEKKFVEMLVRKYQQVIPDIVKAHEDKIEFQGFPVVIKL
ncbi:Mitochodrial transcription termination factor [Trema orientale]|uniref:Mitochodrial transcription termination factor n=1 Tax=Trema orientale TaxID=63057 RepID=A0A2P5DFW4_TREOI|nr:Mitochodrial transcription termination factor [Trema orientale]